MASADGHGEMDRAKSGSPVASSGRRELVGAFLGSFFSPPELLPSIEHNAMPVRHNNLFREARAGIEPANSGFADRCLTTWLPRLRYYLPIT